MLKASKKRRMATVIAAGVIAIAGLAVLSPHTAAVAQPLLKAFGLVTCSSTGPCEEYDNTSTGSGLKGTSTKGNGLVGVTGYNNSLAKHGAFGVDGVDTATNNRLNSGVLGTSNVGTGVTGT